MPLITASGRAVARFIGEILAKLNPPDYSTFSRRATELTVWVGRHLCSQPRCVVIDATGLKVYGEGEWTVRQHGASRHRTWRKRHLAVDADSHGFCCVSAGPLCR